MTKWLLDRYISRSEHQDIVAYYKRLVVHMHGRIRELQADSVVGDDTIEIAGPPPPIAFEEIPEIAPEDNIVNVDFRRRARV